MKVVIPSPLLSYTGEREVEVAGKTVGEILAELDRRYPGFRFRMIDEQNQLRPHMRVFVNSDQVRDLSTRISASDEIHILQALSGG